MKKLSMFITTAAVAALAMTAPMASAAPKPAPDKSKRNPTPAALVNTPPIVQ